MKYYFTYGTDGQPFVGGWTEVEAPNADIACAAFRARSRLAASALFSSLSRRIAPDRFRMPLTASAATASITMPVMTAR